VIVRSRVYCNVLVYRLGRDGRKELVRRAHNAVLSTGLNMLRDAMLGNEFRLEAIGVGSSGTAVVPSQTWGQTPLLCSEVTTKYVNGVRFRAVQQINEDELNGHTIREVWIAPATAGNAFARVVIDDLDKTADFAYIFQFDVVFGGTNSRLGCLMFAQLANSEGAYTIKLTALLCGQGTVSESVADTGLADPWTMTPLPLASTASADGQLTLYYTIAPDQYNGSTLAEAGVYFDTNTGTPPVSVPALFARGLITPGPYEIEVGKGAQVVAIMRWESA